LVFDLIENKNKIIATFEIHTEDISYSSIIIENYIMSLNPKILKTLYLKKSIWIMFAAMIVLPSSSIVFAETVYDINIPSGSADKDAPFHWISEKDGDTSGFIEIIVNDTIHWKNGDTVAHTVTSGIPQTGPDGIFDSGKINPGQLFVQKFTELGEFPYYCIIHPWRTGLVSVVSGYSVLSNVGSDLGDGVNIFDVEYKFNRLVNSASIDESAKSISLELKGNTINDDNTLTLFLPSALISGISSVSIDGTMTENFTQEFEDEITMLVINGISPQAKSITMTGTTIVPEFAQLTFIVLFASISIIVWFTRKQFILRFGV